MHPVMRGTPALKTGEHSTRWVLPNAPPHPTATGPGLASLLWQEQGRRLNYLSVNNGSGGVTWIASPGAERVSLTAFPLTTSRARTLHLGNAG